MPGTLSEQASECSWLPIHDHQFSTDFHLTLPLIGITVANVQGLEVKALKHPSDVRIVVDADHNLTFALAHEVSHPLVIPKRKIHTIAGGLPVRRVDVVKGMGTIIALRVFQPGEVFDVGTRQALLGGREVFLDP